MKHVFLLTFYLICINSGIAQCWKDFPMKPEMTEIWDTEVEVIAPGEIPADPPSDAIVLFDGIDLECEWMDTDGGKPGWKVKNGCVTVAEGTGNIKTKRVFEDIQLHIEWCIPSEVFGEGQGRGNSGIILQGYYELQLLDSYNNRTYRNGQCGSIYKQHAPLVNACKPPGEWQVFDIIYTAPRFNPDGTYFTPPRVTVLHNGVLIQNYTAIRGPVKWIGIPEYYIEPHGPASIYLQNHGNPIIFRNIWVREL